MQKLRALGVGSIILSLSIVGLYACDDDDSSSGGTDTGDSGGGNDGSSSNNDSGSSQTDSGGGGNDAGADTGPVLECDPPTDMNPYCDGKTPKCNALGGGSDQLALTPHECANCARQFCCTEISNCYGNGLPPDDGGTADEAQCVAYDSCAYNCNSDPDAGGCIATCDSQFDAKIVAARKAAADCVNTHCFNWPANFNDGGQLCGPSF